MVSIVYEDIGAMRFQMGGIPVAKAATALIHAICAQQTIQTRKHMTKNTLRALCALALTPAPMLMAGTESKAVKEVLKEESCITGDLGVGAVSQYISRGVVLENQGAIIQPFADLYFKLYEGDGFLNKVSLNLGVWSSLHSRKTDAGAIGGGSTGTRNWYEFDWTAGMAFTVAKNLTITPSIYSFLSPNDGFSDFYGLNVAVAYNDSELWGGKFAINPTFQFLWEIENKCGTGADEGFYYEIGISPTVPVGPVTLAFPVKVGLGSNDFYGSLNPSTGTIEDETFGFVSAGIVATYPLSFIPECYGAWSVNASATYYYLGDGTSDFNTAPRGGTVRDAENNEFVFGGGLLVAF